VAGQWDDTLWPVVADALYIAKIGRELAIEQILSGRPTRAAALFDSPPPTLRNRS